MTENLSSPTSEKWPYPIKTSTNILKKNKTDLYFTPNKQSNEGKKAKFGQETSETSDVNLIWGFEPDEVSYAELVTWI